MSGTVRREELSRSGEGDCDCLPLSPPQFTVRTLPPFICENCERTTSPKGEPERLDFYRENWRELEASEEKVARVYPEMNPANCNADEECNCDNLSTLSTSTQVPETTSITDDATELTFSLSLFLTSMMIRNL